MKKLITGVIAAAALIFGLMSCSGDLHQEASVTIHTKDSSTVKVTGVGGSGVVIDGSAFAWDGGTTVTLSGFGPDYEVTATGENSAGWISEQSPFTTEGYPTGADTSMKIKFDTVEGWICYKKGGSYTFAWADRK